MKKVSIWSKITNLSEDVLSKTVEKIEVLPREKKNELEPKRIEKKPKVVKQKMEKEEGLIEEWLPGGSIGQLSIDLYDKGDELVMQSMIAGVEPDAIEITVEPDLITIKGERKQKEKIERKNYFYRECFWGKFSRTLVLPVPVKPEEVRANLKNGVLTVTLPKAEEKKKNIEVK